MSPLASDPTSKRGLRGSVARQGLAKASLLVSLNIQDYAGIYAASVDIPKRSPAAAQRGAVAAGCLAFWEEVFSGRSRGWTFWNATRETVSE